MFTGRVVAPGEPVFLPEDTALALALAQEEQDTCPSCGYLKAICRGGRERPFTDYKIHEETCQVTLALGYHQSSPEIEKRSEAVRHATQALPRFREGKEPDILIGLDIN